MSKRRILFIIISCLWMMVIFVFSSRNGMQSDKDSYRVGRALGKFTVHDFDEKSEEEQLDFVGRINRYVRKTAHATEYAVLGMLLVGVFYDLSKLGFFLPFIISVLYAVTDEVHQVFVPGRDGNVTDVIIDSIGALIGILLLTIVVSLVKRKKIYDKS